MSRYLITFDMDNSCLEKNYHVKSFNNAYGDIKAILSKHGFDNIQGSVYLGHDNVSEAHGTLAIQELTARFDWFYSCVSNIKFYRLESDLDAQFIVDGVQKVKQVFIQRIEQLRLSLEQAGVTDEQIKQIISAQNFEIGDLSIPLKLKEKTE